MKSPWIVALAWVLGVAPARAEEPAKAESKPEAKPDAPPAGKPAAAPEAKPAAGVPEQKAESKPDAAAAAAPPASAPEGPLKTVKDKVSYGLGLRIGRDMRNQGVDIDTGLLVKGLQDALSGAQPLLNDQDLRAAFDAFQKELAARRTAAAEKNKADGETFLAQNKTQEGVVTLPSGLQYKVLKAGGGGKKPLATNTVITHYRGTLIDGSEFDSSYRRGEPAKFPVSGVIRGWTEALQLMEVGSKWQLFVPAGLAYGERGSGPLIGPNATLIFEVELIGIQ